VSKDDDVGLVRRCRNGDRSAFELLVRRYQGPVYNAAFRLLGNRDDALDVAQIAFLKAFEGLDRYDSRHRFFSWLYRIAVNESLNALRGKGRNQPLSGAEAAPDTEDPARRLAESQTGRILHHALDTMELEDRVILTLRHFVECSYRDIGEILDIPEKTVKSRLYSARQRLREQLQAGGN